MSTQNRRQRRIADAIARGKRKPVQIQIGPVRGHVQFGVNRGIRGTLVDAEAARQKASRSSISCTVNNKMQETTK
ncbi:hypothetical protein LJR220_003060 [Bradyrhizobium sp. LjRoot220]|uniref:hypothetical protein n=1 Tax=Bradyrhizobium sp. LjRoot220 TaxID=3342284 RepID=UPI003ECCA4D9